MYICIYIYTIESMLVKMKMILSNKSKRRILIKDMDTKRKIKVGINTQIEKRKDIHAVGCQTYKTLEEN